MKNTGLLLLFTVCAAGLPRIALACQPPACLEGVAAPMSGATVPAAAPALSVSPYVEWQHPPAKETDGIDLVDENAASVAFTLAADPSFAEPGPHKHYLLVPKAPLAAGARYTIRLPVLCSRGAPTDGGLTFVEQPFHTGAAAPLPTDAGALTANEHATETIYAGTASGSCTAQFVAATAQLALNPSAALAPYLPLTRIVTTVDGKPWAVSEYGDLALQGSSQFVPYRGVLQLYARCVRTTGSVDDDGLTLGLHHVEVRAHVAGATGDPPALAMDVHFACDNTDGGGNGNGNDGGDGKDGGTIAAANGGSGCRVGASGEGDALLGIGACLALAFASVVRRQRKIRSSLQ